MATDETPPKTKTRARRETASAVKTAENGRIVSKSPSARTGRATAKTTAQSGMTRSGRAGTRGARAAGQPAWRPKERTKFLVEHVGGVTALARALNVSASQPSRWQTGAEVPSPEVAARLLDLEHVLALAMQAWEPEVVMDWMNSANGFLSGAEPIEVLRQRGSAEVIGALDATLSGAYA